MVLVFGQKSNCWRRSVIVRAGDISLYSVCILFHLHFIIILCLSCIIKCYFMYFRYFYLYCVIRSFSCLLCVLKLKVIFAFVLSLCVSAALSSLYIFLWVFCDCRCFVSVCSAFTLNHTVVVVFSSSLVSLESIHSLKLLLSLHLYGYFCHFALQTTTNTTRQ